MSFALRSDVDLDLTEYPQPATNRAPAENREPAQVIPIRRVPEPTADAALRTSILAELRALANFDD